MTTAFRLIRFKSREQFSDTFSRIRENFKHTFSTLFHGGKAVRGTWEKDGVGGTPTFRTRAGEIEIPAGHVWMHLIPAEGSVVPPGSVTFQ